MYTSASLEGSDGHISSILHEDQCMSIFEHANTSPCM